jgi:hypothetical protein
MKKKKYKGVVFLTDLGLYSSDMSYEIAGSYNDVR